MPNRLIRDGLLESEAVLSLPAEGRWLYVAILLSADDVGLFEATPFKLARRADIKREMVEKLLSMLVDADLVRLYAGDGIRTFGFIPRFGQRLQIKRAKHPLPPVSLLAGDDDAISKINNLASQPTVSHGEPRLDNGDPRSEPEPEPEPEKVDRECSGVEKREIARPPPAKPAAPKGAKRAQAELDMLLFHGVGEQQASDWLALRKAKKLPLTKTAMEGLAREAGEAGLSVHEAVTEAVERGWGGFRAQWLRNALGSAANPTGPVKGPTLMSPAGMATALAAQAAKAYLFSGDDDEPK